MNDAALRAAAGMSEPDWKARYEAEHEIVNRIWRQLGISSYTGKSIYEHIADLQEAARRLTPPAGWQDIASAPRDGTEVFLLGPCRPRNSRTRYATDANVGWWENGSWSTRVGGEVCDAIYWMPIPVPAPPPPPSDGEKG